MYKTFLLIVAASFYNTLFAQQNIQAKLAGRWQTRLGSGRADDLLFISDSKGAVVTPDNRLCAYFNYNVKLNGKIAVLNFSFDVERGKHPNWQTMDVTFLNDSTFICHATHILKFSSYFTKNDRTYVRLKKAIREDDLRIVTYKDLKGRWIGNHLNNDDYDAKKGKDMEMFFIDADHMVEMHADSAYTGTYKIDFTKQPAPVEFTYAATGRTTQAFLMFVGTDKMRLQYFPNNNRGDHFTDIGYTIWLLRQFAANQQ